MPGRRAKFTSTGDQYENSTVAILGEILSLVHVPWQRDYGVDFYCSVRLSSGTAAQTTRDLFALQVGGPEKKVTYGGFSKGKSLFYQIEWLKSFTIPFFYGRVSTDRQRIDLYSMSPVWRVFFRSPDPFKITCVLQDATDELFTIEEAEAKRTKQAIADGNSWQVNLGPPILSRSQTELQKPEIADQAVALLRDWLQLDWTTIIRFQTGIAVTEFFMSWSTNSAANLKSQRMYWSPVPGANVRGIAEAVQPALVNLGANLQYQDDIAAFTLVPLLDWLKEQGILSPFGRGLLGQLRQALDSEKTPAQVLDRRGSTRAKDR